MKEYVVHFTKTNDPYDYWWRCQADDYDHAIEQLRDAEPELEFHEIYK